MMTEHPLDTVNQEDLPPNKRNIVDRSFIFAPFNSQIGLDDTLDDLTLLADFEPRAIHFDRNVRELNRNYEQNNNADLDNGVI